MVSGVALLRAKQERDFPRQKLEPRLLEKQDVTFFQPGASALAAFLRPESSRFQRLGQRHQVGLANPSTLRFHVRP